MASRMDPLDLEACAQLTRRLYESSGRKWAELDFDRQQVWLEQTQQLVKQFQKIRAELELQ